MTPKEARDYISTFHLKANCTPIEYVDTNFRRIEFVTMSDEDAIKVAKMMQDMEAEAGMRSIADGVTVQ